MMYKSKISKFIILIGFISGFFNCSNDDTIEINKSDVKAYIELLRADQYESSGFPEFSQNDIAELLEYLDDNTVVTNFPHNPISSYSPKEEYRLSVIVLWTIEHIRVSANNDTTFEFPSQNPFVKTTDKPAVWITNHGDEIYDTVRQAYRRWWNENKDKDFIEFSSIDPLENTGYRWH